MSKVKEILGYRFKAHAHKRLKERYGITMSDKEWQEFKSKTSMAQFIKQLPSNRVLRALPFHEQTLFFVWDRVIGEIVTFIPANDPRCQGV